MFCSHVWDIIDKEVIPSPAEQANSQRFTQAPSWAFQRKIVYSLRCQRCQRTRIHEVTGPN